MTTLKVLFNGIHFVIFMIYKFNKNSFNSTHIAKNMLKYIID